MNNYKERKEMLEQWKHELEQEIKGKSEEVDRLNDESRRLMKLVLQGEADSELPDEEMDKLYDDYDAAEAKWREASEQQDEREETLDRLENLLDWLRYNE